MVFLTLGLNGEQALARIFYKAPASLNDLTKEMRRVGAIIKNSFVSVFLDEGAVGGNPKWVPLSSQWTVPERIKQGYGGEEPILRRRGGYMRSFRPTVGKFSVSVASNDIRDTLLQLGGLNGLKRRVPARTITARVRAAFERSDWREIIDILRNGLKDRMEKAAS